MDKPKILKNYLFILEIANDQKLKPTKKPELNQRKLGTNAVENAASPQDKNVKPAHSNVLPPVNRFPVKSVYIRTSASASRRMWQSARSGSVRAFRVRSCVRYLTRAFAFWRVRWATRVRPNAIFVRIDVRVKKTRQQIFFDLYPGLAQWLFL